MELENFIHVLLPYLYALLALAGVFALVQLARLFMTTRKQVDEIGDKSQPILEKADVSVDALNAELLRVDGILSDIETITNAAANTTESVEKITSAPLEFANSLSSKLVGIFKGASNDEVDPSAPVDEKIREAKKEGSSYVTSDGAAAPIMSEVPTTPLESVPEVVVSENE